MTPPIKKGDILTLGVTRFGKNGDPIMVKDKLIIFLKDMEKGAVQLNTMFKIKITKVCKAYAFAVRTE